MSQPIKIGAAPTYDRDSIDGILRQLFEDNGRLRKDDPGWNAYSRVENALGDAYQRKYRKARVPGHTRRKEFVRDFLHANPGFDLETPRRRKSAR